MVIRESFYLWPQHSGPRFVPIEVGIKSAQVSQMSSESVSKDVKTLSRCSTFTSSDLIHCDSPNPGWSGSRSPNSRSRVE
jgi:predicted class III extradiol MEMO1 family dioxygenase